MHWNCPLRESNSALLPSRLRPEHMWLPEAPPLSPRRCRHISRWLCPALALLHGVIPPRFIRKLASSRWDVVVQAIKAAALPCAAGKQPRCPRRPDCSSAPAHSAVVAETLSTHFLFTVKCTVQL